MKQKTIYVAIILFATLSCNKDDEISRLKSGDFVLTEIRSPNLKSTEEVDIESIKNEFQLGSLKASKEFYFLLSNGSDKQIFDIELKTDNSQFSILPESINYLSGKDSNIDNNYIPLITLGIIHGIQLNGVGYTDLLTMGKNTSILTITGKTIEDGDTIKTVSDFSFEIIAKIMDIKLSENGKEIDILSPAAATTSLYGEIIRYYCIKSKTINITNIGNVDIVVTTTVEKDTGIYGNYTNEFLLPINQSSNIVLPDFELPFFSIISLNSNGTITDYSRIRLGEDGNGYFGFSLE